jgi:hypothetical protein
MRMQNGPKALRLVRAITGQLARVCVPTQRPGTCHLHHGPQAVSRVPGHGHLRSSQGLLCRPRFREFVSSTAHSCRECGRLRRPTLLGHVKLDSIALCTSRRSRSPRGPNSRRSQQRAWFVRRAGIAGVPDAETVGKSRFVLGGSSKAVADFMSLAARAQVSPSR